MGGEKGGGEKGGGEKGGRTAAHVYLWEFCKNLYVYVNVAGRVLLIRCVLFI